MHISSGALDGPSRHEPWNKGKLVGPKPPLTLQQVWEIRIRLQILKRIRDLALFNLAIDSKLRSCDLVRLRVADITHGGRELPRAAVLQRKTHMPVRFELTDHTRDAVQAWIDQRSLAAGDYLFPSRVRTAQPISTRQYARIVDSWVIRRSHDCLSSFDGSRILVFCPNCERMKLRCCDVEVGDRLFQPVAADAEGSRQPAARSRRGTFPHANQYAPNDLCRTVRRKDSRRDTL